MRTVELLKLLFMMSPSTTKEEAAKAKVAAAEAMVKGAKVEVAAC